MSLKFRKRLRVFPGFTLNISKTGMSATLGIRGCNVNIGKNGTYLNTGIPGTGIYDRIRLDDTKKDNNTQIPEEQLPINQPYNFYTVETEIKSYNPELLTLDSMASLKKSILEADVVKKEMYQEWLNAKSSKNRTLFLLVILHIIIIGFFLKSLKQKYKDKKIFANELKEDYENFSLDINFNFDKETLNDYITIRKTFDQLTQSEMIWDVTAYRNTDQFRERTLASRTITRQSVKFFNEELKFIKTSFDALVMENANGGNLYIYPGFVIIKETSSDDFGIIDLKNINFQYSISNFIEDEKIPSDSRNVGYTWKYCNKDGSRDRRYSNNYQIPIQQYGQISILSNEGLNEEFMISNSNNTELFINSLNKFIDLLKRMNWKTELLDNK